jgi:uroporphyrinogen III methyltransferase/synthase
VGEVVKLRETINWFERRPLFGETIVVTRTRQQASELTQQLEALGAEVLEAPTIELRPPASWDAADAVLRELSSFDWIVFTSANGVSYAKERLLQIGLDARAFGNAKIAAIGEATRDAVTRELALRVDLCPASFVAEALADELIAQGAAGRRFLLLRADIARPILRERLQQAGAAEVKDVAIYETHPAAGLPSYLLDAIDTKRVTWITFTSSSTARNFVTLLGDDYLSKLKGVKLASIGPITSKTIREHGLEPTVEAATFNIGGLVEAIRAAKD